MCFKLGRLLLLFLLTLSFSAFAQEKAAYKKVKEFYLEKNAQKRKDISYNEKEHDLTIMGYVVPIRRVVFSYVGIGKSQDVMIKCPMPSGCIIDDRGGTEQMFLDFTSKEDCMTFIELLNALKEAAVLVKEK